MTARTTPSGLRYTVAPSTPLSYEMRKALWETAEGLARAAEAQRTERIQRILSGYIWWTGPDGWRLRASDGRARGGRYYTLISPDGDRIPRKFRTAEQAIQWAQSIANS